MRPRSNCGLSLVLLVSLAACGDRQLGPTSAGEESGAGEESSETGESETGEALPACTCVELEDVCEGLQSLNDCDLPAPCPTITSNSDEAEASCVLNLLVEQQPARFFYNFTQSDGFTIEAWRGWVYILEPGEAIDGECYDWQIDLAGGQNETVVYADLEAPDYFADCLDASASVMRGCIFNGISTNGSELAECGADAP